MAIDQREIEELRRCADIPAERLDRAMKINELPEELRLIRLLHLLEREEDALLGQVSRMKKGGRKTG